MRNLSFKYLDVLSLFQILRCTISLSIISMRILSFKIFRKKMAQLPKNDHRCIHHNNWSCGFLNNMDENIAQKIPKGCSSFKRIILLIICAGWQKFCGGTGGPRQKVWTQTKTLSPNIRHFVAN